MLNPIAPQRLALSAVPLLLALLPLLFAGPLRPAGPAAGGPPACALQADQHPAAQAPAGDAQAPPVMVALVRHAEKAAPSGDPELSPAGLERAAELARLLGGSGVTHVFASPTRRARATAEPLRQRLGLELSEYDPRDLAAHARTLRTLPPGSLALSVGHSNTVPALAALLGAPLEGLSADARLGALLPEEEHDRLVLLVLPGSGEGPARRVELRFGK